MRDGDRSFMVKTTPAEHATCRQGWHFYKRRRVARLGSYPLWGTARSVAPAHANEHHSRKVVAASDEMPGIAAAMPLKIALIGATGRTGRFIAALAVEHNAVIVSALTRKDDLAQGIENAEVVLDFSVSDITARVIEQCVRRRRPLVIGTTGHSTEERERLVSAAADTATVWSGNYSIAVNLLFALTKRTAALLSDAYDIEILEAHHRFKRDAPSGTASRLLEIIRAERGPASTVSMHGRIGSIGERTRNEIGVHAIRGGDVVGDHTVIFAGIGESVELIHKASDRAIFARGALRAAHWITSKAPGVYDMQEVLGLK